MQLDDVIETFELLDDWEDRYRALIELGRDLPPLPEEARIEANKVRGCTSQVWMIAEDEAEGRLGFLADSDAHIVKGLIGVLLAAYSHRRPEEILDTDIRATFARLGLDEHLSPNRRSGFFAMVERIRQEAQTRQFAAQPSTA